MAEFPFRSLRDWIEFLESKGQLVRNKVEVDLRDGDVATISRRIRETNGPAVIHENVKGYPGWNIFSDGLTTRERIAWALGLEEKGLVQKIGDMLMKLKPVKPMEVSTGPCKEVKIEGDDIDLTRFPTPLTGRFDIPPYITAGVSLIKHPHTGWQNAGIRRFQLKEKDKMGNLIMAMQHEGQIFLEYIKEKRPMPISIVIGADPIFYLITQMPAPAQVDEMDYWGLFTGEPLQVVKSETNDIMVPATAEIVIEGEIDPEYRELEGPFSEFPGYYSGYNLCPMVKVKCITMRKDALYQYLYMGAPPTEGHGMAELMYECELYRQVKPIIPELRDVANISTWLITAVASIDKEARKKSPGLVRNLGMAVKGVQAGRLIKNLIIVDDDIDVHNLQDVLWAWCVRFQPAKDITIVPNTIGVFLDPSERWLGMGRGTTSYAIYDCTEKPAPFDEGYKRGRATPNPDTVKKVMDNWKNYGFR